MVVLFADCLAGSGKLEWTVRGQNGRYVDRNSAGQKVWKGVGWAGRPVSYRKMVRPSGFEPPTFCSGGINPRDPWEFRVMLNTAKACSKLPFFKGFHGHGGGASSVR